MTYTVVAIFNDVSDAEDAEERLASSGFIRENIDLSRGQVDTTSTDSRFDIEAEGKRGGKIRQFFRSLFADDEAERYSDVARSSDAIISVHATSADEANLAARILDDAGAIDVDQRSAEHASDVTGVGPREREAITDRGA